MLALVLVEAGLDPSFIIGGDVHRARHRRRAGGAASCSWSRPTRATARSSTLAARGRGRHQRRGRPPRPLGRLRGARGAFERVRRRHRRTRAWCAPTTPAPLALAVGRRRGHLRHRPRRRLPHRRPRASTGDGASFTLVRRTDGRRRAGPRRAAGARAATTPATPPRPLVAALELGAPFAAAPRRPRPASAAWPGASSAGARSAASPSSTTTPTCRTEVAGRARRRARRRTGAASSACSSPTATPAPRRCGRLRRRVRRRRRARGHRHLRRRRGAPPRRHRPSSSSTPCSTPTRAAGSSACPTRGDLVDLPRRRAAPRRPVPDARRRRHHHRRPTTCWPASPRRSSRDRRSPRRRGPASTPSPPAGPGARRDVPARPAHHLPGRRPGRAARRASTTRTTSPAWPRSSPSGRCRSWWWARARTCWWPTGASPGWPSCSATRFAEVEVDGTVGAGRRRGRPARRRPPDRGRRAHRLRVGRRRARLDRRRGAHERRRPRLRHGRDACARVRVVDLAAARMRRCPLPPLELGYRRSAVAPDQVVRARPSWRWRRAIAPSARPSSPRSCGGGGPTSPAGRTPARCSPTRPATPPAGSSTPPGCKGLRVGTAEVSAKHANFIQADRERLGRRRARASWPSIVAGSRAASGVALHAETRLVGFDDPTAERGPVKLPAHPRSPPPPRSRRPVAAGRGRRRVRVRLRRGRRRRRRVLGRRRVRL